MKLGKSRKAVRISFFTLTELLVVSAIVSSIPAGAYIQAKKKAVQMQCMNNMRQVGMALISFQLSNGAYPQAAFYPKNPKTDKDSIRVILSGEITNDKVWLCPAMPEKLKKKGLTWVYNDTIAGKAMVKSPAKTWVLIEFSSVSKKVPSAHPGGYNIVYADGHVETSRKLPADIKKNQQALLEQLIKEQVCCHHH